MLFLRDKVFGVDADDVFSDPESHISSARNTSYRRGQLKKEDGTVVGCGVIDHQTPGRPPVGDGNTDQNSKNQSQNNVHVVIPLKAFSEISLPGFFHTAILTRFSVTCVWKI